MVAKSGILINIYMVILAWDMCLILFIVLSDVIGILQSVNGNMVENEKSFFLSTFFENQCFAIFM